jgi:uncharacterized membrane protein YqjE
MSLRTPPPDAAPGSTADLIRSARGLTGAYFRLASAEASLARRALVDAAVHGGIALGLALVAALLVAAALVAALAALGLAWPWAALAVAATAALGAALSFGAARRRLDETRFEATRRQLDKLFD